MRMTIDNREPQYVALRSHSDKELHLIVPGDNLDAAPPDTRHRGPWIVVKRGPVARLKPRIRHELARTGYVVIVEKMLTFAPEA
jgi:hypothetical protein